MRIYKFYSAQRAREAIDRRRLKISTLNDINDPFEFGALAAETEEHRTAFKKMRDNVMRNKGIVSFSKSWKSPLLWSHYAENHKGVALGFEVPEALLVPVVYKEKRPKLSDYLVDAGTLTLNEDASQALLAFKAAGWSYEEEVRLFARLESPDRTSGLYFVDFDKNLILKELILGAKYKPRQDEAWTRELKSEGVVIKTARMAFRTFEIVEQKTQGKRKIL